MNEKEVNDFLDVLRDLNKENINEIPERRDNFFKSLMVCADNVPGYFNALSDEYFKEFEKQHDGNIAKDFILSGIFCSEIVRQINDKLIEDRKNCLYIDKHNATYVLPYAGSIKGMRNLVEKSSLHFDFLKQSLLRGLMHRYCKYQSLENTSRLNKLIVIYAEYIRGLKLSGEIPMIIDNEFLSELELLKNDLDTENIDRVVDNLIDRKYPDNNKELYYLEKMRILESIKIFRKHK